MNQVTSIKQKTLIIELDSQKITVRRMYWKAAKEFIKKLAKHLAAFGANGTSAADILPRLPEIITNAEDLVQDLVINSTDLTPDAYDKLDVAQAAAVLEAAVELNLGDELKNSFAGIGARISALAMKTSSGAAPTLS